MLFSLLNCFVIVPVEDKPRKAFWVTIFFFYLLGYSAPGVDVILVLDVTKFNPGCK
jgi:hypothetical protein